MFKASVEERASAQPAIQRARSRRRSSRSKAVARVGNPGKAIFVPPRATCRNRRSMAKNLNALSTSAPMPSTQKWSRYSDPLFDYFFHNVVFLKNQRNCNAHRNDIRAKEQRFGTVPLQAYCLGRARR